MIDPNKMHVEHSTGDFIERERLRLRKQERQAILMLVAGVLLLPLFGLGLLLLLPGGVIWITTKVERWTSGLYEPQDTARTQLRK